MAAATGHKTVSIYDYPEHLNPFREDDQHRLSRLRFWTLGRKISRSNSITFSGIKELKNSWTLRSFMKKGKRAQPTVDSSKTQTNGETSPVVYRRPGAYTSTPLPNAARSTIGSPERPERYVYGGSITPLPRSRFQERLRSPSQIEVGANGYETPRMARSEVSGSRLSVESTNPFDEHPVPPVRASRRKKKRAPPPPPADVSVTSIETVAELSADISKESKVNKTDDDLEDSALHVELKITEGDEEKLPATQQTTPSSISFAPQEIDETDGDIKENKLDVLCITEEQPIQPNAEDKSVESKINKANGVIDDDKVSFPKVDIIKYRRNSSLNEDDFRPKILNIENDKDISNQRSKSLNYDLNMATYDINLNEGPPTKDANDNDQPQKVVCKVYDGVVRKHSIDNSISSTEREFIEIDKATKELEREINKLNTALSDDDTLPGSRLSVTEIRRKFDNNFTNPNPIPKPKRSHHGSSSPINGNYV